MTLEELIKKSGKSADEVYLANEIWQSSLTVKEKIILSLELNEQRPSYLALSIMWLEYGLTNEVSQDYNNLIYSHYQSQLTTSDMDLSATTEYSLYFNIFEDPERNHEAWSYFLKNNPSKKFLKTMLACSGPVPYDLKHKLYEKLLADMDFHIDIYVSIRNSCFDNCGQINRTMARGILFKLKLDDKANEITKLDSHKNFSEVASFLKD